MKGIERVVDINGKKLEKQRAGAKVVVGVLGGVGAALVTGGAVALGAPASAVAFATKTAAGALDMIGAAPEVSAGLKKAAKFGTGLGTAARHLRGAMQVEGKKKAEKAAEKELLEEIEEEDEGAEEEAGEAGEAEVAKAERLRIRKESLAAAKAERIRIKNEALAAARKQRQKAEKERGQLAEALATTGLVDAAKDDKKETQDDWSLQMANASSELAKAIKTKSEAVKKLKSSPDDAKLKLAVEKASSDLTSKMEVLKELKENKPEEDDEEDEEVNWGPEEAAKPAPKAAAPKAATKPKAAPPKAAAPKAVAPKAAAPKAAAPEPAAPTGTRASSRAKKPAAPVDEEAPSEFNPNAPSTSAGQFKKEIFKIIAEKPEEEKKLIVTLARKCGDNKPKLKALYSEIIGGKDFSETEEETEEENEEENEEDAEPKAEEPKAKAKAAAVNGEFDVETADTRQLIGAIYAFGKDDEKLKALKVAVSKCKAQKPCLKKLYIESAKEGAAGGKRRTRKLPKKRSNKTMRR